MVALSGKTALVTGAASGIGEGMAVKLAETGANLAICDLQEAVHDVAEKIANDTGVTVVLMSWMLEIQIRFLSLSVK